MRLRRGWRLVATHAVLVTVCIAAAACARARAIPAEIVLEIFNPQPQAMVVSYTLAGTATELGTIAASDTKRWAIPAAGKGAIHLVATDTARKQTLTRDLDLRQGAVLRWEIRP